MESIVLINELLASLTFFVIVVSKEVVFCFNESNSYKISLLETINFPLTFVCPFKLILLALAVMVLYLDSGFYYPNITNVLLSDLIILLSKYTGLCF